MDELNDFRKEGLKIITMGVFDEATKDQLRFVDAFVEFWDCYLPTYSDILSVFHAREGGTGMAAWISISRNMPNVTEVYNPNTNSFLSVTQFLVDALKGDWEINDVRAGLKGFKLKNQMETRDDVKEKYSELQRCFAKIKKDYSRPTTLKDNLWVVPWWCALVKNLGDPRQPLSVHVIVEGKMAPRNENIGNGQRVEILLLYFLSRYEAYDKIDKRTNFFIHELKKGKHVATHLKGPSAESWKKNLQKMEIPVGCAKAQFKKFDSGEEGVKGLRRVVVDAMRNPR